MAGLAKNCKGLKKFSCGSCMFGAKGINALLDSCSYLEELSVKRLRGINDGGAAEPIGPGAAASSLKSDWDRLLETIATVDSCLVEVHLERLQVTDVRLSSLSNCSKLKILHIVKTLECTITGVVARGGTHAL
uniref:Uncharacterized protein n=1 Tax=Lactuca sativa TaxID=4236 RepID=A0A9R1V8Y1_LACSA|nr:hypothetical protein LSAT_V11C600325900 [Lactuca sativa]